MHDQPEARLDTTWLNNKLSGRLRSFGVGHAAGWRRIERRVRCVECTRGVATTIAPCLREASKCNCFLAMHPDWWITECSCVPAQTNPPPVIQKPFRPSRFYDEQRLLLGRTYRAGDTVRLTIPANSKAAGRGEQLRFVQLPAHRLGVRGHRSGR